MAETYEYALLAGAAYVTQRHANNRIPAPSGWDEVPGAHDYDATTGFEAVAYRKGNEIVIAFAGTDQLADWLSNFGGVAGAWVPGQLQKAAAFYARIRQQYGEGVSYSFTGHSLGGGLAALMGVLFDQKAETFDQAPFRLSANNDVRTSIRNYLSGQSLLLPSLATALDGFWSSMPAASPSGTTGIRGEGKVSDHSVAGEILTSNPLIPTSQRIGGLREIMPHAGMVASADDLHSIALAAAMKVVPGFAAAAKTLPQLIPLIFDSTLYSRKPTNEQTSFMELLLRREVGMGGTAGDGMLDHFTADVQKIVAAGGRAVSDTDLNKALITFALQAYHNQEGGFTQELFQSVSGGLRFERATVVGSEGTMAGYTAFQAWLGSHADIYSPTEMGTLNGASTEDREWFIATTGTGMSVTGGAKAVLMLGGAGIDNLTGGSNNDLLIGGSSADILTGGQGDDLLMGGTGADTYLYKVGDGNDTIDDSDAQSAHIMVSAADGSWTYAASTFIRDQNNPNLYTSPDGQVTLTADGNWVLHIGGGSLDLGSGFTEGDYGIHLVAAAVANTTNTITYTDTTPADDPVGVNENPSGSNTLYLGTGNDDRIILAGGAGNVLVGNGGIDSLDGGGGDDQIFAETRTTLVAAITAAATPTTAGSKAEYLSGNGGDDLLVGAARGSWLLGGGGRDSLVGGGTRDVQRGDTFVNGMPDMVGLTDYFGWNQSKHKRYYYIQKTLVGGGSAYYSCVGQLSGNGGGDLIVSGAGDDEAWGELGNDSIELGAGNDWGIGGEDNDTINGGDGDDLILGDLEYDATAPAGNESPGEMIGYAGLEGQYHGRDTLVGGNGDDIVEGNGNDDWIDGGDGNDELHGDDGITPGNWQGSDTLIGGDGQDRMWGDGRDDVLAGGKGNDQLSGDNTWLDPQYHGNDDLDGGAGDNRLAIYSVRHIDPAWPAEYPAGIPDPRRRGPSNSRNERELVVACAAAAGIAMGSGTMKFDAQVNPRRVSRGGTPANGEWRLAA